MFLTFPTKEISFNKIRKIKIKKIIYHNPLQLLISSITIYFSFQRRKHENTKGRKIEIKHGLEKRKFAGNRMDLSKGKSSCSKRRRRRRSIAVSPALLLSFACRSRWKFHGPLVHLDKFSTNNASWIVPWKKKIDPPFR